jgi:hypothetical protein
MLCIGEEQLVMVNGLGAAIYRHVLGPRLGPVHAKGEPRRIGGRSFEEANE